jgi:hypothetical protein
MPCCDVLLSGRAASLVHGAEQIREKRMRMRSEGKSLGNKLPFVVCKIMHLDSNS